MSSETETELRQRFQNPLREFQLWKQSVQRLLDNTADVSDPSLTLPFLHQIEGFLAECSHFKEQFLMLQLKKDFLSNIFEEERAKSLLVEATDAMKEAEHLHKDLLQMKSRLQALVSQHKDFGTVFEQLQKMLSALRTKLDAEKEPLTDLTAKEARLQRLQIIHGDVAECGVQMDELEKLVQLDPTQKHKMKLLSSEHQLLKRSLETITAQSKQHVQDHWTFNNKSTDLWQWLTVTKQKLDSCWGANDGWKTNDLERLQMEFPDKENQLQFIEAKGELVAANSSSEGAENVEKEAKKLLKTFESLENMMTRFTQKIHPNRTAIDVRKKITFSNNKPAQGFFIHSTDVPSQYWKDTAQDEESNGLQLIKNFEQWLQGENARLSKILATKPSSSEELNARHSKLKELQSRVPEGQHHFEDLLRLQPIVRSSEELEDLRYRWMLYKSKLHDSLMTSSLEEPIAFRKGKPTGACSFLRRVCCAALPLQLLLLFLLLLAFLLPLAEETHSCKLANNFARSFNLMLRYEGPPPT